MAKKGMVARDVKRAKLTKQQADKRAELKRQMRANAIEAQKTGEPLSIKGQLELAQQLAELPRNGSKVRMRNRCRLTGRPRGYYRKFGISRVLLRELGSQGMIPGLVKSSW